MGLREGVCHLGQKWLPRSHSPLAWGELWGCSTEVVAAWHHSLEGQRAGCGAGEDIGQDMGGEGTLGILPSSRLGTAGLRKEAGGSPVLSQQAWTGHGAWGGRRLRASPMRGEAGRPRAPPMPRPPQCKWLHLSQKSCSCSYAAFCTMGAPRPGKATKILATGMLGTLDPPLPASVPSQEQPGAWESQ